MIRLRYALLPLLVIVAACKCSTPDPVPPPSLVEIVASLFDDLLDETADGIKPAVRGFLDQNGDTTSKADLAQAWNGDEVLAGQFKLERVYQTARDDGAWKTEAEEAGFDPDEVPDPVYIAGVRKGLEAWLEANQ